MTTICAKLSSLEVKAVRVVKVQSEEETSSLLKDYVSFLNFFVIILQGFHDGVVKLKLQVGIFT